MKGWVGKKVYILLKNGKPFQGRVLDENEESITILDKFDKRVSIAFSEVALLKEEF